MMLRLVTSLAVLFAATASHAAPGEVCAKLCRRLTSCKLMTYDLCMDMCGEQGADRTPQGRASTLAQSKQSCPALAAQMATSKWLCIAEGTSSYGYGMGMGPGGDVRGSQSIFMAGNGKTRAAAVYEAVSNCNSIMTVQLNQQRAMHDSDYQGEWGAAVTSACHITQCIAPSRTSR